jgi:hypothetical protein
MNCGFCGEPNSDTYTICSYCGLSRYREWCCLLCGNGNAGTDSICKRCNLPRGKGGYRKEDIPAGWERADIVTDEYEEIDKEYVWARLSVKVRNSQGEFYTHRTAGFKKRWYNEELPEPMSEATLEACQKLRELLFSEGWQSTLSSQNTPQPFSFWRHIAQQGLSVQQPLTSDRRSGRWQMMWKVIRKWLHTRAR